MCVGKSEIRLIWRRGFGGEIVSNCGRLYLYLGGLFV